MTTMTTDDLDVILAQIRELAQQRSILIEHTTASSNRITALCRGFVLRADPVLAAASLRRADMTEKEKKAVEKARAKVKEKAMEMAGEIKKGKGEEAKARAKGKVAEAPPKREHARIAVDMIAENMWTIETERDRIDAEIGKIVKVLPVAPWIDTIKGFSHTQAGLILAETGDLSKYSNPAKVWKRMGLGVMDDGTAQRRVAGRSKTKDEITEAEKIGFSPRRRSAMFMIEDTVLRQSISAPKEDDPDNPGEVRRVEGAPSTAKNALGAVYLRHRVSIEARIEAGEKIWKGAHYQARRRMGKELLRQFWVAWKRSVEGDDAVETRDPFRDVRMMQSPAWERHASS